MAATTCSLTVASQNVGMSAGQRIGAPAAATLAAEQADLLCMQEGRPLRGGEFEDNASMVALASGFTLLEDGPYLTRVRPDPSLAAISLEPPLYEAADLQTPALVAKYKERTFQQITVDKAGHTILVLNVHCRCGSAQDTAPEFRKLALRRVKDHAERALARGTAHAAVLGGDLNLSEEDITAAFAGTPWSVHHILGGARSTGQRFCDVLAFITKVPSVRCGSIPSTLGCGANQLSDVHGAGKLVLTIALPESVWTRYRYRADEAGTAYWWAKGTLKTDEMLDCFLEESAASAGWTLVHRGGEQIWRRKGEFFYAASGFPFPL